jgi:sec-independent protein translocase protein TatA
MPALGAPELIIILVIIVLIFGVGKLPEVGQALGKGIREFRSATDDDDKKAEEAAQAQGTAQAQVEATKAAPAIEAPVAASNAPVTASNAPVAASNAPAAPASNAPVAASNGALSYTIKSGDTLESVAQGHGISVEALMQANGFNQRDRVLYAGDRLQIPRTTAGAS